MDPILETVLHTVVEVTAAPAAALFCGLLWRGFNYLGLHVEAKDQANMEAPVRVALGRGEAAAMLAGTRQLPDVLDSAASYFMERFPKRAARIAKKAGVTTDEGIHNAVYATVSARVTKEQPAVVNPPTLQPWAVAPGEAIGGFVPRAAPTLPRPV